MSYIFKGKSKFHQCQLQKKQNKKQKQKKRKPSKNLQKLVSHFRNVTIPSTFYTFKSTEKNYKRITFEKLASLKPYWRELT